MQALIQYLIVYISIYRNIYIFFGISVDVRFVHLYIRSGPTTLALIPE